MRFRCRRLERGRKGMKMYGGGGDGVRLSSSVDEGSGNVEGSRIGISSSSAGGCSGCGGGGGDGEWWRGR